MSDYPLGEPIRPQAEEAEEWVADNPAEPHIQRNTKTGMWRNAKATPLPIPVAPWGWWP